MKTINKQPKIRFKGYTDEWQQRKLKDVLDVMDGDRGKNYPSSNDFLDNGHTLFLSASNVTKEGFQFTDNQFITENKSNSMGNGKVILNDIILTSRGSIGHTALYSNKINELYSDIRINSGMLILRSHTQNYPLFIIQFLKSPIGKTQIDFISFGSAQPQITKKDINNFPIQLPSKEEQIKIGDFFTKLDDIIALHQRKLEALEKTKKSFLQKMFPTKDETKPEIRFAGYTDDWEQRKLGEYVDLITKGTTPKDKSNKGTITFVKVENISNGKVSSESKISVDEHEGYLKRSRLEENDILFSIAGTLGRTAIVDKSILPANTNQALAIIRGYKFNQNFLLTSLNGRVVSDYIRRNPTIGAQPNLSLEQVRNLNVWSPNTKEQQKIGSFFKQLDDTIALHQRQLEVLKNMKTSFLQKMYI